MKLRILTACAIAVSSLSLAAPRAFADGSSADYRVPFNGIAVGLCLIDAVLPVGGTLENAGDSDTLSTLTPGSVAYFCNDDTRVSVDTPEQINLDSAPEVITGTLTSSISGGTTNGIDLPIAGLLDVSVDLLPGAQVVNISMEAVDDDGVIKAGTYDFEVPLTITCL